jgi:hypothetical protein
VAQQHLWILVAFPINGVYARTFSGGH